MKQMILHEPYDLKDFNYFYNSIHYTLIKLWCSAGI